MFRGQVRQCRSAVCPGFAHEVQSTCHSRVGHVADGCVQTCQGIDTGPAKAIMLMMVGHSAEALSALKPRMPSL